MEETYAEGFPPVFDQNSRVLILGSFPSVKSRQIGFYYGNPQNRFWRTVCGFFSEEIPASVEGKREFLLRRGIALWDVVCSCYVIGSQDHTIRAETTVELSEILKGSRVERIFCNGKKSFELLLQKFPELSGRAKLLPSTSPANPRFSKEVWESALKEIFPELPEIGET